jgi:hypothetical protein
LSQPKPDEVRKEDGKQINGICEEDIHAQATHAVERIPVWHPHLPIPFDVEYRRKSARDLFFKLVNKQRHEAQ